MINLGATVTSPAKPEVSVIIVTYGARELTMSCLESVASEIAPLSAEVIIVDNGSPTALVNEITSAYPAFQVIPLTENSGFASAANLAADTAKGRYLLLLNPDTLVLPGAIRRMLAFARRRSQAGIWGGQTLFAGGEINPTSCRRGLSLWQLFCTAFALDTRFPNSDLFAAVGYGGWRRDNERSVDVVCGSFMLVHRDLWDRLGGFSPPFFMYSEDEELCLRARRLGFNPVFSPEPAIIHSGSGTECNRDRKIRHLLASRALLIRAYYSPLAKPFALLLLMLRPRLGSWFATPPLRSMWRNVWAQHHSWLRGQFR